MKVKNQKLENSSENCILKSIPIEQDCDKFIVSIPKKKISLQERFQEYHSENMAKHNIDKHDNDLFNVIMLLNSCIEE